MQKRTQEIPDQHTTKNNNTQQPRHNKHHTNTRNNTNTNTKHTKNRQKHNNTPQHIHDKQKNKTPEQDIPQNKRQRRMQIHQRQTRTTPIPTNNTTDTRIPNSIQHRKTGIQTNTQTKI